MFCSKCGNELKSGEHFCPNCGTKVGTTGNSVNLKISADDVKNKALEMKGNFVVGMADLGKNKILILGNAVLLVLSLLFSFTKVFNVDAILGVSEGMSMFEDMAGIKTFFIIFYLFAVIILFVPLLFKKAWSPKIFLPAKITTILSSAWFLIVLFTGLNQVESSGYSSIAEFNLSGTGWFFVITTIGALILAYKNAIDLKKAKGLAKSTDQDNIAV